MTIVNSTGFLWVSGYSTVSVSAALAEKLLPAAVGNNDNNSSESNVRGLISGKLPFSR